MTTSTCPVHHVPLKEDRVEISYGLMDGSLISPDRIEWQEKYFPYANSVVYGGCVIESYSPQYAEVLYCWKCRKVEKILDFYG